MLLIFTITALKSVKNLAMFEEQVVVWESAEPPLNSLFGQNAEHPSCLTSLMLLSPVLFGQFDFSDVARDVSMLVSLYMRLRKLLLLACPMV